MTATGERQIIPGDLMGECPYRDTDRCDGFPHDCPEPVRCVIDHLHDLVGARHDEGVVVVAEPGYRVRRLGHSDGCDVEVQDGFGGSWLTCGDRCDLHVVRPGKVQCNATDSACPNRPEVE